MLSKMQDFLAKVFDQRGGTWTGAATASVIGMAWIEFIQSGFDRPVLVNGQPLIDNNVVVTISGWHPQAPPWWIVGPACIYLALLAFFVVSKQGTYFVDSRWNSPAGEKPKPGPPPPPGP